MNCRFLSNFLALLACGLAVGLVDPRSADAKVIILLADAAPDRRTGTVYMNSATIAAMVGADTAWDNKAKSVRMARGERSVTFRAGDFTALINGQRVTLPAAPYLNGALLMVPAKITATAFSAPLRLEEKTESLVVGPVEGTRDSSTVFIVPLETNRTGLLIHSHKPGSLVPTSNVVQLQANIAEGRELVLQLREADGTVLIENVLPAQQRAPGQSKSRGRFGEHIVGLTRATSDDNGRKVRFVAFMRKATRPALAPPTLPKIKFNVPIPPQKETGTAAVAPTK